MFLNKIKPFVQQRILEDKKTIPLEQMKELAVHSPLPRPFINQLKSKSFSIIAEIKPASPSAGNISENIQLQSLCRDYENGGAAAISILTEPDYFKGDLKRIKEAKNTHLYPY